MLKENKFLYYFSYSIFSFLILVFTLSEQLLEYTFLTLESENI